jgi:hypothetical protein
MDKNVAVQVAQDKNNKVNDEFTLNGVNVRLVAVPVGLIQDAQSRLKIPKVPTFFNDSKGREEENPVDPDYLMKVDKYNEDRGIAALDTMLMFGIEIDGLPENDSWLKKIKWLHKRGTLDLSAVDFDDEIDLEFLFKKYVVGTRDVITDISKIAGVGREAIAQAKAGFRP